MSRIYPPNPTNFHNSSAEKKVFECLRDNLGEGFRVYHSLSWLAQHAQHNKRKGEGEADFTIFHPEHGILIIEVKGGALHCRSGQWYRFDPVKNQEIAIDDPKVQADAFRFELQQRLKGILPYGEVYVVSAVWFPDYVIEKDRLPLNYDPSILFDKTNLKDPAKAITGAFEYWKRNSNWITANIDESHVEKIHQVILPEFGKVRTLELQLENEEKRLIELTRAQQKLMNFLSEWSVALIQGPAGTGKTMLALEKARHLAKAGERVLLICYNRALKEYLAENFPTPNVDFSTFHGLSPPETKNYDDAKALAAEYIMSDRWPYRHVIVDEAQDFENDWLEYLHGVTIAKNGCFYVFCDPLQLILKKELPAIFAKLGNPLTLSRNCRNARTIAKAGYRLIDRLPEDLEELPKGSKITFRPSLDADGHVEIVRSLTKRILTKQKRAMREIVIITLETFEKTFLKEPHAVHEGLRKFDPSDPTLPPLPKQSIRFTTVRKFKGLESPFVILTDVDVARIADDNYRRLLYTAFTRARSQLHVVLKPADEQAVKSALTAWLGEAATARPVQNIFAEVLEGESG